MRTGKLGPHVYVIPLDEKELRDAEAQADHDFAVDQQYPNAENGGWRYGDTQTPIDIARLGRYGEWAGHRLYGWPYKSTPGKDGGVDSRLGGLTIQVKATHDHPKYHMMLFKKTWLFKADIAVQFKVDLSGPLPRVRCVGWTTRNYWLANQQDRPAGRGVKQPSLEISELSDPDDLLVLLLMHPPSDEPEPVERLYTGPRSDEEAARLARAWEPEPDWPAVDRPSRHDRHQRDRTRSDAERIASFRQEQARRKAAIEAGEVEQPPEYKGQVFERATNQGVAYDPTPPYRDDPFSGLTMAFVDFQTHHHLTRVRTDPTNYCTECRLVFASVVCPYEGCRSARVRYPKPDADGAGVRLYHCLACSRGFEAERVCGGCLAKRPEVQARLRTEAEARAARKTDTTRTSKAGTRVRKGNRPRTDESDFYPD